MILEKIITRKWQRYNTIDSVLPGLVLAAQVRIGSTSLKSQMLLTVQPIWIDFVQNWTNLNDLFESMRFESCLPQDLETDLPGWTWDIVVFILEVTLFNWYWDIVVFTSAVTPLNWCCDIVVFSSCHNCLYVNINSQTFELIQMIWDNVGKT